MSKILSLLLIAISISSAVVLATGQEKEKSAPTPLARKIPGITTDDKFPRGCIDCHTNRPELNLDKISSLMQGLTAKVEAGLLAKAQAAAPSGVTLKGKHPPVAFALKNIPASCMTCHGKSAKSAPPFAQMLHNIHLTGGDQNRFLTVYQGECTHCHKLNPATGLWSMPSSPEG